MKAKILAVLVAVLAVVPSLSWAAAATWTLTGARSATAVCATGTCDAPTLATEGMNLDAVKGFSVVVSADNTRTLSGAGALRAYTYDGTRWARCPDLDLTTATASVRDLSFAGFTVTAPRGRIAYVPDGVTVSAGGVTIQILASGVKGEVL
jgi:hypothetical protein